MALDYKGIFVILICKFYGREQASHSSSVFKIF